MKPIHLNNAWMRGRIIIDVIEAASTETKLRDARQRPRFGSECTGDGEDTHARSARKRSRPCVSSLWKLKGYCGGELRNQPSGGMVGFGQVRYWKARGRKNKSEETPTANQSGLYRIFRVGSWKSRMSDHWQCSRCSSDVGGSVPQKYPEDHLGLETHS